MTRCLWPRKIFLASTSLGVYVTEDHCNPTTQPTWAAINTGLAATDCMQFALDPSMHGLRQYVMLNASKTLYRRDEGGEWAVILSPAMAQVITGSGSSTLHGFCVDETIAGRLWVTVGGGLFEDPGFLVFRSDDYGDSWEASSIIYSGFTYGIGALVASGDNVWVQDFLGAGSPTYVSRSSNGGASWAHTQIYFLNAGGAIFKNPLMPDTVYVRRGIPGWNNDFATLTIGGTLTNIASMDGMAPYRWDAMWFDPYDVMHQRLIYNSRVYSTSDGWATVNSPSAISPAPYAFSLFGGKDLDQMVCGLSLGSVTVGVLDGEDDVAATGISSNLGTACTGGVQALPYGEVFTYGVSLE